MSRMGVSYQDVELVAEQLLQQGDTPTIEKIRACLGTGSFSTLSKYLNQWKNQRLRASTGVLPALQTTSDPVNAAVQKVWQQLQADNVAKMAELERVTEERIQALQIQKQEIEQAFAQAVTDNDSLRTLLRDERIKNDVLAQQEIELKRDLAVYQEKAHQFEQRAIHAETTYPAQLNAVIEKHQHTEQQYQQQLGAQRTDYQLAMGSLKEQMENIRHQHMVLIDELRTENHKMSQQLSQSCENATQWETQAQEQHQQLQALLAEKKQWMNTISDLDLIKDQLARLGVKQEKMPVEIVTELIHEFQNIPLRFHALENSIQELHRQMNKKPIKHKKSYTI